MLDVSKKKVLQIAISFPLPISLPVFLESPYPEPCNNLEQNIKHQVMTQLRLKLWTYEWVNRIGKCLIKSEYQGGIVRLAPRIKALQRTIK